MVQTHTRPGCFASVSLLAPPSSSSLLHSKLWRYWNCSCAACGPRHTPQSPDLTRQREQSLWKLSRLQTWVRWCPSWVIQPGSTSMRFNSFLEASSLVFGASDRIRYSSYPITITPPSRYHFLSTARRSEGFFTVTRCWTCHTRLVSPLGLNRSALIWTAVRTFTLSLPTFLCHLLNS